MTGRDKFYNKAKQEGYRARSAYKLQQLDDAAELLGPGAVVVDLGAAPGGWLQVAAERAGPTGQVLGVDRQRIEPLPELDGAAPVDILRGDLTDETVQTAILDRLGQPPSGGADVVLSDMAPNVTGEYELDHARSVHLARIAADVAVTILVAGGDFAVKVFDGPDTSSFRADLETKFDYVRSIRPEATRDSSSEQYLIGKGRLTAPVTTGEELTVDIQNVGDEGDGIATVEGFTLFVPGAEPDETVRVQVTDVKPRFGFAERLD